MTAQEYQALSDQLSSIAPMIPQRWGRIQNDRTDASIHLFAYKDFEALERAIKTLPPEERDYFRKRWFVWRCAQCDEYLFYRQEGVRCNPESKDKAWDVEFCGRPEWRFDLKSTVVPYALRAGSVNGLPDAATFIRFNYAQQSKGVRYGEQNRLFAVHIPLRMENENILRTRFEEKAAIFSQYVQLLRQKPAHCFFPYKNAFADIIYIIEQQDRTLRGHYPSMEI